MRNRLTIATVALLLLVPANAFADEHCYGEPLDDDCTKVSDESQEAEEDTETEVADEVEEASVEEVVSTSAESDDAALAETGVSATLFSVIAALMLAAGALLLVVSRRRGSAA